MTVNVAPLHDRILVTRREANEVSKSGITIPDTAKAKPQEAEVVAAVARTRKTDSRRAVNTARQLSAHWRHWLWGFPRRTQHGLLSRHRPAGSAAKATPACAR